MESKKHSILYAFFSNCWRYGKNSKDELDKLSIEVIPEAFSEEMQNKIFCPICATPLSRTPALKNISTNNISAHFKHGSHEKYPESKVCGWRVNAPVGMKYKNEEEVGKAIEAKDLVVVSSWQSEPPSNSSDLVPNGEFSKTAIENKNGPETLIAIARHTGREYKAPSNVSTVMALCKDFPQNLKRGFYFPNSQYVMLLSDQLYSTLKVQKELPKKETLFFGKITSFNRLSHRNVLKIKSGDYEFKIYSEPSYDERKSIDNTSIGRYILFSATLYWEADKSVVACKVLKWGAYSLLPTKYEQFLTQLK
ncbi:MULTISPECIES: hypothetical protein [unclassified Pseudoalteromonas]|uniref:hypothetical protein n=1 Tax=unclassified Pseudoalteromonas TaxID=194690 RepID=UPI0002315515|nr:MULTISPECIES: hypothetical protein [unclassified Pseudoalteromonas]KDC54433.1 hypothetical protein DO88_08790 [Pseudoalteromonas sp. S3431]GAA78055.1 hypothetical protein P20495_0545 [Pseudoalteromonas sp. BSi20495]